jgi:segregation and condensation protein A
VSYKISLEIFEGPLDLLLHLVKQNHLEIEAIPIASITDQYLRYLEMMEALDLEIAGEFLVVAATLMQIKSRALLPPETLPPADAEEPDPAQELIARLKEYQKYKQAAEQLAGMEKERMVQYVRPVAREELPSETEEFVDASLFDLLNAFSQFMAADLTRSAVHEVFQEEFTVEEKVLYLRQLAADKKRLSFTELFRQSRSKPEAIATFLGLLELLRMKEVGIVQSQLFGDIEIVLREVVG